MVINHVKLQHFRSYKTYRLTLDPKLTIIVGKNGVGKTNLLEALYVALHGTSFRAADSELVQHGAQWWRVQVEVDETEREVRFETVKRPAKQLIEGDTRKRFSYKNRLPVVLFEPQDLLFISGSPSRRRDTLDHMIGLLAPVYKQTLGRYERALLQRNNLLKQRIDHESLKDQLFVWDVMLSETSQVIIEHREKFFDDINHLLPTLYAKIAGVEHAVSIEYHTSLPKKPSSTQIISLLHSRLSHDTQRGTTSVGPHRDDMYFTLSGVDAKTSASRGESRSLVLSLKLAYASLLRDVYETEPVVLLDDVFSELDTDRQHNLLSLLGSNQTIITDTKKLDGAHAHVTL